MDALILAAGQGLRLRPFTQNVPKALIELCGAKLVDYVLDCLAGVGVENVGVVVGYQGELLKRYLTSKYPEVKIYVNEQYEKGSICSLTTAKDFLKGEFLLLNVDHIYPVRLLRCVLSNLDGGIVAICDFDRKLEADDMKVRLSGNRRKLIAISKELTHYDGGYIGMTYCSSECLPMYLEAAQNLCNQTEGIAVVEEVLQKLVDDGGDVSIFDASGFRWLEIDTVGDLNVARSILGQMGSDWL